jgi:hypothetical protein
MAHFKIPHRATEFAGPALMPALDFWLVLSKSLHT